MEALPSSSGAGAGPDAQAGPAGDHGVRRVHSTGDIPLSPELAQLHERLQALQATLEAAQQRQLEREQRYNLTLPPTAHTNQRRNSSHQPYPTTHFPPPRVPQANGDADRVAPMNHSGLGRPIARVLAWLGLSPAAPRSRRIFVRFAWNMVVDVSQFVTVLTLLVLISQHWRSRTDPTMSEWAACDRPLGVWASFWLVRLVCSIHVTRSEYQQNRRRLRPRDVELAVSPASSPPSAGIPAPGAPGAPVDVNAPPIVARPTDSPRSRGRTDRSENYRSRLSLLTTFITLVWFLTAHILEYASINTCRHSSPHLWWLVFGILSLMYIMIAEVVILAVVLLVIAPILIVSWNLFLYCIGRHPIQNPHQINPEIGKLPKSIVERIPLVTYIPPPSENEGGGEHKTWTTEYPPKPLTNAKPAKTGRFRFLRRLKKSSKDAATSPGSEGTNKKPEQVDWEAKWEQNEYPFVILEENRAACSICLLDFVAPHRKDGVTEEKGKEAESAKPSTDPPDVEKAEQETSTDAVAEIGRTSNLPTTPSSENEANGAMPTLEDAGEESQPLRLLECGHVFHKTCLDPWLLDVSGRCPVCQRPVKSPEENNNTRRRRA